VTPSPFIGKQIIVERKDDGTAVNDFGGKADPDALDLISSLLTPDQDFYPDHPVAVGDTWEASDKYKQHMGMGKDDTFKCVCKLESVRSIDGKQLAGIAYSMAIVRHDEEHVESDVEEGGTFTVDIAAGQIIKSEQGGKTKYSTPADVPTQVTGSAEDSSHMTARNEPEAAEPSKP
jgi:hypothetical protein